MWVTDQSGRRRWLYYDSIQDLSKTGDAIAFLTKLQDVLSFAEHTLADAPRDARRSGERAAAGGDWLPAGRESRPA